MKLDTVSAYWAPVCPVPFAGRNATQLGLEQRVYTFWFWRFEIEVYFDTTEEEAIEWMHREIGR